MTADQFFEFSSFAFFAILVVWMVLTTYSLYARNGALFEAAGTLLLVTGIVYGYILYQETNSTLRNLQETRTEIQQLTLEIEINRLALDLSSQKSIQLSKLIELDMRIDAMVDSYNEELSDKQVQLLEAVAKEQQAIVAGLEHSIEVLGSEVEKAEASLEKADDNYRKALEAEDGATTLVWQAIAFELALVVLGTVQSGFGTLVAPTFWGKKRGQNDV